MLVSPIVPLIRSSSSSRILGCDDTQAPSPSIVLTPSKISYVAAKSTSFMGIYWMGDYLNQSNSSTNEIQNLNQLVIEKTKIFVAESLRTGEPLPIEVEAVLDGKHIVYKERCVWFPIIFMTVALVTIVRFLDAPLTVITAGLFTFVWYDLFSGILHIVLDNPSFIKMPILCDPCLEFQWHHHIPGVSQLFQIYHNII